LVQRKASEEASGLDRSNDELHHQLERILASKDFKATARERRFLRYVVEETLSGRGGRIKAYSVAVEVFGRDASFDPQNDPIVRIEAGHLRRSLERYYLTAGQADPIVITIPKGAYVPVFATRPLSAEAGEDASPDPVPNAADSPIGASSRWRFWPAALALPIFGLLALLGWSLLSAKSEHGKPQIPRLLVEPFVDLSGAAESKAIALGLRDEIAGQLSKFKDVTVVLSADPSGPPPRYLLTGSVNLQADTFRLRVNLVSLADGSVLWADSYDGGARTSELVKSEASIARDVATSLAQTYGVIFQADAAVRSSNPPDDWAAYSCTLSYYAYRVDFNATTRPAVRACLERAVERFPRYSTAWALLSQIYVDEFRFSFPHDRDAPSLYQALAAAKRAVEIDPLNVRGLQAQMFALYFNKDIDAALKTGARAIAINPNDTELMGEYGYRLALSGHWDQGCPLVQEARERNPGPLAYYEVSLALCSYFRGELAQAVTWIRNVRAPDNALYHIIAAAIFAEAGLSEEAARERGWLEENAPALLANAKVELASRMGRVEDADRFASSMRKAGIAVSQ
jgi:TolB-like protein/Tfp pilus assembly protein PilF